jgi:mannose-6-phosphate isomerase-like protein (cupin superfamily)
LKNQTLGSGSVWDIAFSQDPQQKFLYIADGENGRVHILDRESLKVLTSSVKADASRRILRRAQHRYRFQRQHPHRRDLPRPARREVLYNGLAPRRSPGKTREWCGPRAPQSEDTKMRMTRKTVSLCILTAAVVIVPLPAQDTRPSCNRCSATYIKKEEIQAYLKRAPASILVLDQQVRAVDAGKTNVDVGVVYRGKLTGESPVAEHDLVSEVYHIIDGSATLVTGPDIEGLKRRPPDDRAVRLLNGPGANGTSIRNGVVHELKPGDVLIVPAGVGHWFTRINDHITYLMVRIDPDKVTPLKDEAASQADLRGGGQ